MQFVKLKKNKKIKNYSTLVFDDQMKEIFFTNVLPLYTKSHSDKDLNHVEACKMSPSILAVKSKTYIFIYQLSCLSLCTRF